MNQRSGDPLTEIERAIEAEVRNRPTAARAKSSYAADRERAKYGDA